MMTNRKTGGGSNCHSHYLLYSSPPPLALRSEVPWDQARSLDLPPPDPGLIMAPKYASTEATELGSILCRNHSTIKLQHTV